MDFKQALDLLLQGKVLAREYWSLGSCVYFDLSHGYIKRLMVVDDHNQDPIAHVLCVDDVTATDWIEVIRRNK